LADYVGLGELTVIAGDCGVLAVVGEFWREVFHAFATVAAMGGGCDQKNFLKKIS